MIREYAIEPQLVAELGDPRDFRFAVAAFGLGQPRVMAEYPKLKNWRRQVLEGVDTSRALDAQRVVELVKVLSERMAGRLTGTYDGTQRWLDNALREHGLEPFAAILARANPTGDAAVIDWEHVSAGDPKWDAPRACVVQRRAGDMAGAVAGMLGACSAAIFVDPHFAPEMPKFRRPFGEFMVALRRRRNREPPARVEIQLAVKSTAEFFESECKGRLAELIPAGWRVRLVRLRNLDAGAELHNRYILTDLGGVTFGHGLDDGGPGEDDDVTLMDKAQYLHRWEQYGGSRPGFSIAEEPVDVVGTRR